MRKEAAPSLSLSLSLYSFDENVNLAGDPLEKLSQLIPKRLIPFDYHPIAAFQFYTQTNLIVCHFVLADMVFSSSVPLATYPMVEKGILS